MVWQDCGCGQGGLQGLAQTEPMSRARPLSMRARWGRPCPFLRPCLDTWQQPLHGKLQALAPTTLLALLVAAPKFGLVTAEVAVATVHPP